MPEKVKAPERERRDWTIILIILLLGFLCVILAGEQALRFSPNWKLNTSMDSNINPDSIFLTSRPNNFFEPIDSSILTPPAWLDVFLTPGAIVNTRPPESTSTPISTVPKNLLETNTSLPINTSLPTNTIVPTITALPTNTPFIIIGNPTKTSPPVPPDTSTPVPPNTSTPIPQPVVDLQITKTNGSITYIAGGTTTYTIIVSNPSGPSNVTGAKVTDTFLSQISSVTWTCLGVGGATCPSSGTGNINHTVNLPVGSSVTYTANANISPAASGNLVNTAAVSVPAGYSDPTPGNNSATDTDTPVLSADLQITKTDNATDYVANALKRYTITVTNVGPSNVAGATVSDVFSTNTNIFLPLVIWSCSSSNGGACAPSGAIGDINNTVNLPSGSSVTYTVFALVVPSPSGALLNTATVTAPAGISDPNPLNNSATDTDQLVVVNGTVDSIPGSSVTNYLAGSYVTLQFGTPLVVGSGSYLIYYPSYSSPSSTLPIDLVILQIGDGSNWYTVFNWGNGSQDTNTDIPAFPPNTVDCTSETDNCPIDISLLTINNPYPGVTINIPASVPAGTYPYIRIISPPGGPPPLSTDSGDGLDVDAIQVFP